MSLIYEQNDQNSKPNYFPTISNTSLKYLTEDGRPIIFHNGVYGEYDDSGGGQEINHWKYNCSSIRILLLGMNIIINESKYKIYALKIYIPVRQSQGDVIY